MNEWKRFWFEGNLAWGMIYSLKDWERIKKEYTDTDLSKARQNHNGSDNYGFYSEHTGNDTLGEFFIRNGMII